MEQNIHTKISRSFFLKNDIKLIHSTPGNPQLNQQNGRSERINKLLINVQPHYLILPNYHLIFGILHSYVHVVYTISIFINSSK